MQDTNSCPDISLLWMHQPVNAQWPEHWLTSLRICMLLCQFFYGCLSFWLFVYRTFLTNAIGLIYGIISDINRVGWLAGSIWIWAVISAAVRVGLEPRPSVVETLYWLDFNESIDYGDCSLVTKDHLYLPAWPERKKRWHQFTKEETYGIFPTAQAVV